jgi:hypothetical protein
MRSRATVATLLAGALCVVVLGLRFLRSDVSPVARVDNAPLPAGAANDVSYDRARKAADVAVVATPAQDGRASELRDAPLRRASPQTHAFPTWTADALAVPLPTGMQNVDSAFAAEPVDPLWATNREAEILGELAQTTGLQVRTIQVECRTTACRVQIAQSVPVPDRANGFAPDANYYKLFDRLGYQGSARYPMAITPDGAGTATWVVYLARANAGQVAAERLRDIAQINCGIVATLTTGCRR